MVNIAKVKKALFGNVSVDWNKKTTMVVTILTVLVVGLVVVNFDRFTGSAVSSDGMVPKVYVSSKPDVISESNPVIKQGSNVYVTVETGGEGIKNPVNVYSKVKSDYYARDYYTYKRTDTARMRYGTFGDGRASNCASYCNAGKTVAGYVTTSNSAVWGRGMYCAMAEDRISGKKAETCFTVE